MYVLSLYSTLLGSTRYQWMKKGRFWPAALMMERYRVYTVAVCVYACARVCGQGV